MPLRLFHAPAYPSADKSEIDFYFLDHSAKNTVYSEPKPYNFPRLSLRIYNTRLFPIRIGKPFFRSMSHSPANSCLPFLRLFYKNLPTYQPVEFPYSLFLASPVHWETAFPLIRPWFPQNPVYGNLSSCRFPFRFLK